MIDRGFDSERRRSGEEALVATGEHMLPHVDAVAGRAAPAEAGVLAELGRIAAAQSGLPAPRGAGRHIEGGRLVERA